ISKKTAALISASAHIGALLATNDLKIIESFKNFGKKIGIAFQIRDDIIGIWSKKTGKPKASDIINKKKTLPIIYGFEKSKKLKEIYQKNILEKSDVSKVLKILEDVNSLDYSQKIAEVYEKEAMDELNKTGISNKAMDELKTITEFLVKRDY
ncbi:MAG: polyprenyl synthetase family protein, partial [Methanosarcinales archaeon]